jgi:DNA-binding SARP family transcriptional activator
MLRVRLLGALALEFDGDPLAAPRAGGARALLAYLALNPGPQPRGELASRFWPDVLDESARQSLRNALWALRRDLGPAGDVIAATGDSLALVDGVQVDARELDAALDRGDVAAAAELAERGELLRGFEDEWALAAREERRDRLGAALASCAASASEPLLALAWCRRRARLEPLSEDAVRGLMSALAAAGDRAAALAAYERFSERLRRELRVAPSRETRELAAGLRDEEPVEPRQEPPDRRIGGTERTGLVALPRPLPLLGRSSELAALVGEWAAARAGSGGVVVLEGEAGIGKSRLAAELAAHAVRDGARVALGAGIELEAAAPLAPWAELLDTLLDARSSGFRDDARWRADLARLVPRLGLRGRDPPEEFDRVRLYEAVVSAVAEAAADAPLLLVLEDAHLADGASLALLAHLGRRLHNLASLLIVTRRPVAREPLDAAEEHLAGAGVLRTRIVLAPLHDPDASALVRAANAALDPEAVRRTVSAADGNPLLAVESARALGRGHEGPPPSLMAAVRSLLRGLATDARGVADLLAVAGRALEPVELDALPVPAPALAAADGVACGLLEGGEGPLGYRHALMREAAYAALEPPRRRLLHERVADALIGAGERHPAEVARHLRRAGRHDRAVDHLARAARAARDLAALTEARAFVLEALELRSGDPELWLLLAHIEALRGRREAMFEASENGLARLAPDDSRARGLALLERGVWLSSAICWPAEALADLHEARRLLDGEPGLEHDRGRLLAASAWAEAVAGDPARVEELLAGASALARTQDVWLHIVDARINALIRQDRAPEALALADDVEAAVGRGGGTLSLGNTLWLELSSVAAYVGEHERALEFIERFLEVSGGLLSKRVEGLAAKAYVLVRLGRPEAAVAAAEEMVELADELGAAELPSIARHDLGFVLCEVGEHARGVELLDAVLVEDGKLNAAAARLRRAESLISLGRLDEAAAELRAIVLTPLRPADQPETLVPRLARVQALLARARHDDEQALRYFDEAAAGWRGLGGLDRRDAYMSNLVDLGRPPVAGLTEPARELERVLAERKELLACRALTTRQ